MSKKKHQEEINSVAGAVIGGSYTFRNDQQKAVQTLQAAADGKAPSAAQEALKAKMRDEARDKLRDEARDRVSSRAVRMVRALQARGFGIHSITLYGRAGGPGLALPIDGITADLVGVE